jgi:micrococcal nuclease
MIRYEDTVKFVFPIQNGHVVKVYDGDTITVAAKMPYSFESPMYRFSVRLLGIDTAEIKTKSAAAKLAKEKLQDLVLHKNVVLKNVQNEKYGRILADVYLDELHVNQWMIDQNLAVPYDGKTKHVPDTWS